ncbi:hypothetical protein [Pseudovibrio sp. SPO723]|uniref:hypothetical protein n=1 Tax=Nesiotobacter zosterae TaxID=392721 RepID=UPI0029C4D34B|nr:hypothetical protein [Pseudovibrio sp. SPO723]MDX5592566.1 hypothetical protein [Pseudovibrio sp. SPO723]
MAIRIEKIETGFAAYFPYELKDNFRTTFKTAKWNGQLKRWEVGPRSGKRLEQWAAEAQEAAEAIEQEAEAELTEQDLAQIRNELAKIKGDIEAAQERKEKLAEVKQMLADARAELDEAKQALTEEKAAADEVQKDVATLLANVCDMKAVAEAHKAMIKNQGIKKAWATKLYREAQEVIEAQHDKLRDAGFVSEGLEELENFNVNRTDRDNARRVTEADILTITKIDD